MVQNSQSTKRRWQSAAFGLVAVALCGLALRIVFTVPGFDPWGRNLDAESIEATITKLPNQAGDQRWLMMNLESGSIFVKKQPYSAGSGEVYAAENKRIIWTRIESGTQLYPMFPYRYKLVDNESQSRQSTDWFEFPTHPTWLTDSVFVGREVDKIYALDVSTDELSDLPQRYTGRPSRLIRIPNSRRFISITAEVLSSTRKGGQTSFSEIFEVDSNGQFIPLKSMELQDEFSIGMLDGKICYVSPDTQAVTFMDPKDLSSLTELPFPEDILERVASFQKSNIGVCSVQLREQVVSLFFQHQEHCHFLLPDMKRITTTDKFTYAIPIKGNDSLLGLSVYENDDLNCLKIIDLTDMRELWRREVGEVIQFDQRDGLLIYATSNYGFTANVLDVQSGKVLIHRAPYAWLTLLLPILLLGSVLWSWHLVGASQLEEAWSWGLAALLSALLLAILLAHDVWWGYRWSHQHSVLIKYVQGYFVAALSAACAWSVWGKGGWLSRSLPFFVTTVLLIGLARWMVEMPAGAVDTVGPPLAMSSLSFPLFGFLRVCGLRKRPQNSSPFRNKWRMPLRDLFVVSALVATLLAVALPLPFTTRISIGPPKVISQCLIAECLLLLGYTWAAICFFKQWGTASLLTLLVLISLIALEALYPFVTAQPLFLPCRELPMVLFRIVSSAILLFVILLPCCLGNEKSTRFNIR